MIALLTFGGNGLVIVVNDDILETFVAELLQARDGAPVKLHRGSDAIYSAAEDDDASFMPFGQFGLTFLGYGDRDALHVI